MLYKRKGRCRNGKLVHQAVWIIKDADRNIATGCVASPSETRPPREAEQALADYIARKYQPERNRRDIDDIDCADALSIYLTDVGQPGDQFEIEADWSQPKIIPLVAGTCKRVCYNFCFRGPPTAGGKVQNGRQLAAYGRVALAAPL